MPNLDGIETTHLIQESKELKQIPKVIMVSAYGREEAMDQAQDVGIEAYLVKPVNPSGLLNAILEAFDYKEMYAPEKNETHVIEHIRGACVLLVEDNEINQQVAKELLASQDILVDIAENGQVALDLLEANPEKYSVVLMDIQMPVMDGYEATKQIRQQPRFQSLPVIAMTANVMVGDKDRADEVGMVDYIAKPIDVKELFRVLGKWVATGLKNRFNRISNSNASFDQSVVITIPHLKGVNTHLGLKRVGEDRALYLKILTKFREGQSHAIDEIQLALQKEEREEAKRIVHTLKGLAGSIGAEELQRSALALEKAIQVESELPLLIDALAKQLNQVLDALTVLDTLENISPALSSALSEEDIKALITRLISLLEGDDADAIEVLEALSSVFSTGEVAKEMKRVIACAERYEFDVALEKLNKIDALVKYRAS
jgi:CheY-like chemotaxis protein